MRYHCGRSSFSSPQSVLLPLCKSGSLSEAFHVLNSIDVLLLPSKPIIYSALLQASVTTSKGSSSSYLRGLPLHSHVLKSGLDSDRFVCNSLLSFYFKLCPDFSLTRQLFDTLPVRDVISWTSMLSGYLRIGKPLESLRLFTSMSSASSGIEPNAFTLSVAIKASSDLGEPTIGRCFHGMVLVRGFHSNYVIASALMDFYGRSSSSEDAHRVFKELPEPDAICWTTIISAFTRNDRFQEAVVHFYLMNRNKRHPLESLPDEFTFGTIMTAFGNLGRARQGKQAHAKIITSGLCGNVVVESSIVDMYGKCGLLEDSHKVFDRMAIRNAVTWCALLGGYCQSGDYEAVLTIFRKMDKDDDRYSFGTVLRACAGLAAVRPGKEVHCRFLRMGGWRDVVAESALVDVYAKCGLIDYAYRVFAKISVRNTITWNAMICGFAQNGRGQQAIELFNDMVREGTRPDYISFIGVLFACNHTGLVENLRRYFKSMTEDYDIIAGAEHYNCMVDLLSRVGLLEEAEDLINNSVFRDDSSLWAAILGACATHSNPDIAERVAKKMMVLEPQYHLSYILLANVYRTVGRWHDATEIWRLMRSRDVTKAPGTFVCSALDDLERSEDGYYMVVGEIIPTPLEEGKSTNSVCVCQALGAFLDRKVVTCLAASTNHHKDQLLYVNEVLRRWL